MLDLPADMWISSTFNVADLYEYYPPNDVLVQYDNSESSSSLVRENDVEP